MTKQRHLERRLRVAERVAAQRTGMRCNPRIQFGRATIPGTRITCGCVQGRFLGGDSVEQMAEEYRQPSEVIQAAIRCGMWLNMQFYVCEECANGG